MPMMAGQKGIIMDNPYHPICKRNERMANAPKKEAAPEAEIQEREKQSYAERHAQEQVLEEIYLRILFEDVTVSRTKKMKMLESLFSDISSRRLRASHMAALDKIRSISRNAKNYNVPITYNDLRPSVVSHNSRNELQSN